MPEALSSNNLEPSSREKHIRILLKRVSQGVENVLLRVWWGAIVLLSGFLFSLQPCARWSTPGRAARVAGLEHLSSMPLLNLYKLYVSLWKSVCVFGLGFGLVYLPSCVS